MKTSVVKLGVNIDHIATIRQARGTPYPDILEAAKLTCRGGADQITVHLREDRRHVQDRDLALLKKSLKLPLNLEMAAVEEVINIALKTVPAIATLVPERRQEQTTECGLSVTKDFDLLARCTNRLKSKGIEVSLFIDPNEDDLMASSEMHVSAVEFHTGLYSLAPGLDVQNKELDKLASVARLAKKRGLRAVAGHGLNYDNTKRLIEKIPEIEELNIGHAIVARSVFVGMEKAVKEMKTLLG